MAVGSYAPSHRHAEVLDFRTGNWTVFSDYPYSDGPRITSYATLFIPEASAYFIIGGSNGKIALATVGKFKSGVWSKAGEINKPRSVSFVYN